MVTNAELNSRFQSFSQDLERTKKTLQQLNERLCTIEAKLEEFSIMKETLNKLSVAIWQNVLLE
jgi:prefoldin subunit 5